MGFVIFLLLVVAAVVAWRLRVPLLARLTGQSQTRIRRRLDKRD